MSVALSIREHIARLSSDEIFVTRDLLVYGERGAVDMILHKLVKRGFIFRLARGVFRRGGADLPLPAPFHIAQAKARAFGKDIWRNGEDGARQAGILKPEGKDCETEFHTSGCTTAFSSLCGVISFKKTAQRKSRWQGSLAAAFIWLLWWRGKDSYEQSFAHECGRSLGVRDWMQVGRSRHLTPAWLQSCLRELLSLLSGPSARAG